MRSQRRRSPLSQMSMFDLKTLLSLPCLCLLAPTHLLQGHPSPKDLRSRALCRSVEEAGEADQGKTN